MSQPVQIELRTEGDPLVDKAVELLERHLAQRCNLRAERVQKEQALLSLELRPELGLETFKIADESGGSVVVAGGDPKGLLYGTGKLMRTSLMRPRSFIPGEWRGESWPDRPVRGMYFATHFHNFYHCAPIKKIQKYVEELALWGINSLQVWFDMHHFHGIEDPAAQQMIERLRAILEAGKSVGMDVGLCLLANEAFADSPEELRANPNTGTAHYRVELCPNKTGAKELMLKWFDQEFEAFQGIGIDQIWLWPYDQGGCACEKCAPWGANGFLEMSEAIAELARDRWPELTVILSTWLFDLGNRDGEWEGLTEAFDTPPEWLDYILADGHEHFPDYPLEQGVPGDLPLLNFPEISMFQMFPWGGFGANPQPSRFQGLWNRVGGDIAGGFPYSEGIFEDINKAILAHLYWDEDSSAEEAVREYATWEFGRDYVEDVVRAIEIFESNHGHAPARDKEGKVEIKTGHDGTEPPVFNLAGDADDAEECYDLLSRVDTQIPEDRRNSWRWRQLLLRALIDKELLLNGGVATPACEEAFGKLAEIYHAEEAELQVLPPGAEQIRKLQQRSGD
ncbi:MAG: hypothetical protein ACLFWL_14115 [Candidatus Brocadiia bacterium]